MLNCAIKIRCCIITMLSSTEWHHGVLFLHYSAPVSQQLCIAPQLCILSSQHCIVLQMLNGDITVFHCAKTVLCCAITMLYSTITSYILMSQSYNMTLHHVIVVPNGDITVLSCFIIVLHCVVIRLHFIITALHQNSHPALHQNSPLITTVMPCFIPILHFVIKVLTMLHFHTTVFSQCCIFIPQCSHNAAFSYQYSTL